MNHLSQKTTILSVASLLTAAALVTASSLLTTRGVVYAQEEFNVDVAIDSVSWDPRTKEVTVDFTVTCSEPAEFADSLVVVRQVVGEQGRFGGKSVSGFEFIDYECSGETPLSVTLEAETGFFTAGNALVFADALACTEFVCDFAITEEQVQLSP